MFEGVCRVPQMLISLCQVGYLGRRWYTRDTRSGDSREFDVVLRIFYPGSFKLNRPFLERQFQGYASRRPNSSGPTLVRLNTQEVAILGMMVDGMTS
jgi:hypothetical protein